MTYYTKIKKSIFVLLLCLITTTAVLLVVTQTNTTALSPWAFFSDGDIVKTNNSDDVYIIKNIDGKKFKRLILNPEIFDSYGHLEWRNIKIAGPTAGPTILTQYKTSNLIRQDGDTKVYELVSNPNADTGTKHWINLTQEEFLQAGFDPDSIYTVNDIEGSNEFYKTGSQRTAADYPQLRKSTNTPQPSATNNNKGNSHIFVSKPSDSRSGTTEKKTSQNSGVSIIDIDDENPPVENSQGQRQPQIQIAEPEQQTPTITPTPTIQSPYNPRTNKNCVTKNGYNECFVLEGRPSQYQWNSYVKGTCFGNCEFNAQRDHRAIDIRSATGTKVLAVWDGVVEFAGWDHAGCGETVTIRHAHVNRVTVSCHLHPGTVQVRTGQKVKAGQYIGGLGRSGTLAFSTHLHFRVHDTTLAGWPYNHGWPLTEELVVALEAFQGLKKGVFHGEHKRAHDARDHQYSHAT